LVNYLSLIYLAAQHVTRLAKKPTIYPSQSTFLARRALDLVNRFNAAINPNTGPSESQRMEYSKLYECVRLPLYPPNLYFHSLILDLDSQLEAWRKCPVKNRQERDELFAKIEDQHQKMSRTKFSFSPPEEDKYLARFQLMKEDDEQAWDKNHIEAVAGG
jgi:hypothetical protein